MGRQEGSVRCRRVRAHAAVVRSHLLGGRAATRLWRVLPPPRRPHRRSAAGALCQRCPRLASLRTSATARAGCAAPSGRVCHGAVASSGAAVRTRTAAAADVSGARLGRLVPRLAASSLASRPGATHLRSGGRRWKGGVWRRGGRVYHRGRRACLWDGPRCTCARLWDGP